MPAHRWILGPTASRDLLAFGGSAVLAWSLVAWAHVGGWLHAPLSGLGWLAIVVAADVAHVWSTIFRVYTEREERHRLRTLAWGVPLAVFVAACVLHAISAVLFWRVLAYAAVFHFVRQQAGWVSWYAHRAAHGSRAERAHDQLAIYAATLGPLAWWHGHLPRRFAWFVQDDFVHGTPTWIADTLHGFSLAILATWALKHALRWLGPAEGRAHPGTELVIVSTWLCWEGGIVWLDSDVAFTFTNVLIHGIPYMALVWRYHRSERSPVRVPRSITVAAITFVGTCLGLAFLEEVFWDQLVWHDHAEYFGDLGWRLPTWAVTLATALLATPQAAHYALDAWIWRGGSWNPGLSQRFAWGAPLSKRTSP